MRAANRLRGVTDSYNVIVGALVVTFIVVVLLFAIGAVVGSSTYMGNYVDKSIMGNATNVGRQVSQVVGNYMVLIIVLGVIIGLAVFAISRLTGRQGVGGW